MALKAWWGRRALWQKFAIVAVVGITAIAPFVSKDEEDQDSPASQGVTTTARAGTTTVSLDATTSTAPPDTTTTPTVSARPVTGTAVDLPDGSRARLNSVTPDAEPLNTFFAPDPGFTFTRLDVELCAGPSGLSTNPLYWIGFLEDNSVADVSLGGGDFQTVTLAPGGCNRGLIDLELPEGHTVVAVVLTGGLFSEIARWDTTDSVPTGAPLDSGLEVQSEALGTSAALTGGATAVVKSVVPNADPLNDFFGPDTGRQFVRIEVELCAGSEALSVNPLYWLAVAEDNRMGSASLGGGTLPALSISPGNCVAGSVEIDLPADTLPAYILFTQAISDEVARWRVR